MTAGAPHGGDLSVWAAAQAALLRQGRVGEIDAPGLAGEMERLGARQGGALRDRLAALVCKLLMWKYMPGARLPSWRDDIVEHRDAIASLLAVSPSLGGRLAARFAEAYGLGRSRAAAETGIDVGLLPETPPFTLAEVRDGGFLPLEPGLGLYDDLHRIDAHVPDDHL